MRTFLLPTNRDDTWFNPMNGKPVKIYPLQAKFSEHLIEYIEEENMPPRLKKHPAPSNVIKKKGAKRHQLNKKDFEFLAKQGNKPENISNANNRFLLQSLRNQQ